MTTTRRTDAPVDEFLAAVRAPRRRSDAVAAVAEISRITGAEPAMWGPSIIGFGDRPYTTADGREHDWFAIGLSPRAQALTFYGLTFYGSNTDLLDRLGPHTTGKGCVYVKRFEDLDPEVFAELVARAWSS